VTKDLADLSKIIKRKALKVDTNTDEEFMGGIENCKHFVI
jgi:hypothetical protein